MKASFVSERFKLILDVFREDVRDLVKCWNQEGAVAYLANPVTREKVTKDVNVTCTLQFMKEQTTIGFVFEEPITYTSRYDSFEVRGYIEAGGEVISVSDSVILNKGSDITFEGTSVSH